MTKRQEQWMEVGMAFETPHEQRTAYQGSLTHDGLCFATSRIAGNPGASVYYSRLKLVEPGLCYWAPIMGNRDFRFRHDFIRATFAYLMAAMTDRERDAIVEGL